MRSGSGWSINRVFLSLPLSFLSHLRFECLANLPSHWEGGGDIGTISNVPDLRAPDEFDGSTLYLEQAALADGIDVLSAWGIRVAQRMKAGPSRYIERTKWRSMYRSC
jgi:hypothetical protein